MNAAREPTTNYTLPNEFRTICKKNSIQINAINNIYISFVRFPFVQCFPTRRPLLISSHFPFVAGAHFVSFCNFCHFEMENQFFNSKRSEICFHFALLPRCRPVLVLARQQIKSTEFSEKPIVSTMRTHSSPDLIRSFACEAHKSTISKIRAGTRTNRQEEKSVLLIIQNMSSPHLHGMKLGVGAHGIQLEAKISQISGRQKYNYRRIHIPFASSSGRRTTTDLSMHFAPLFPPPRSTDR